MQPPLDLFVAICIGFGEIAVLTYLFYNRKARKYRGLKW